MPRNFGFQGKRDDQVTFSEVVAGICLGIVVICCLYAFFFAPRTLP